MSKKNTTANVITDTDKAITDTALIDTQSVNDKFLNISKYRIFANCGMERTIFDIGTSSDTLTADITFKKTRLRDQIPEYAGIYWLFPKSLNIKKGVLQFRLRSPNKMLESVDVEIKPEGRAWMHEVFHYKLPKDSSELSCEINIPLDFMDEKTAQCLNEITFVIHPSDFVSDTKLTGQLVISGMSFTPETEIYEGEYIAASSAVAKKLSSIDGKVDHLGVTLEMVSKDTKAIRSYIESTLNVWIEQMKKGLKGDMDSLESLKTESSESGNSEVNQAISRLEVKISKEFSKCTTKMNDELMYAGKDISKTVIEMSETYLKKLFKPNGIYNKMLPYTRVSLISAACLWESCKNIDKNVIFDYSGICISATSALENELKRVFFYGFYTFLRKERHNRNEKGKSNKFTMHTVVDILWPDPHNIDYILTNVYTNFTGAQEFKDEMKKYLSTICGKNDDADFDCVEYFREESKRIDIIRENYRNRAAHTDSVDRETAAKCYNEIIGKSVAEQLNQEVTNILLALYQKIKIDILKKVEEGK